MFRKKCSPFIYFVIFIGFLLGCEVAFADSTLTNGTKFGDWVFECVALAPSKTNCVLSQTIVAKENNQQLAKFNILRQPGAKQLSMLVLVPLGIDFQTPITLSIDKGSNFNFRLDTCIQNGCVGTILLDDKLILALKSDLPFNLSFKFKDAKDPTIINGSLTGLSEGLKTTNL